MGKYGWFTTLCIYLSIAFDAAVVGTIDKLVELVGRFPRFSLCGFLGVDALYCLYHALQYPDSDPLYSWLGVGMLFAAFAVAILRKEEPARRRVRVTATTDNWLRDRKGF